MCGIFGIVGECSAPEILISGLKELEYRGYDSAGLAVFEGYKLKIVKAVGSVKNLEQKINKGFKSGCGIAHTRWATHGNATELNCHPHKVDKIVLVHNGIVENYQELINKFKPNLKTETDTEIIAFLINENLKKSGSTLKAISETLNQIKGSYACAVLNEDEPKNIYVFKKQSPLVLAATQNLSLLASDATALYMTLNKYYPNVKEKYYNLKDYEIAKLHKNKIEFFNKSLKSIKKQNILIKNNNFNKNNKKYKYFMLKEIEETPEAVFNTLNFIYQNTNENVLKEIENATYITFVGCGTAYHACHVGKLLFEQCFKKKVAATLASEFRYNPHNFYDKELIIAISQSGETADTLAALKLAKTKKLKTIAITNVLGSTITNVADFTIYTKADREVAVAATKTFSSQIAALYSLTKKNKNKINYLKNAKNIQNKLKKQINYCKNYKKYKNFYNFKKYFFIGRNIDSTISLEGALKLKEITYLHAEGYAAGELKHGTLSLLGEDTLVIAIITKKSLIAKTVNAAHEAKARGAKILIVSQFKELKNKADYFIKLENLPASIMPVASVIPLQFLAYKLSCYLKLNPDKPRNLAKSVTVE